MSKRTLEEAEALKSEEVCNKVYNKTVEFFDFHMSVFEELEILNL